MCFGGLCGAETKGFRKTACRCSDNTRINHLALPTRVPPLNSNDICMHVYAQELVRDSMTFNDERLTEVRRPQCHSSGDLEFLALNSGPALNPQPSQTPK